MQRRLAVTEPPAGGRPNVGMRSPGHTYSDSQPLNNNVQGRSIA